MIPRRSVKKFLDRPREDYRSYKTLTAKQLDKMAAALEISPPIWSKLKRVQKICFIIGARERKFAFFLDTGMGKTFLSVALARYCRKIDASRRHLVLVPNKANKEEWARDVAKLSPTTSLRVLRGSSAKKWQDVFANKDTLTVETYAGLARMVSVPVKMKKTKTRPARVKLKPSASLMRKLLAEFDGLVMDESISVQNKGALPYRICRKLARNTDGLVIELNGTPFGRDPQPLWAQLNLVDNGYTLGETLGLFRAAFYTESKNNWGGIDYTFDKKKTKLLHKVISHKSIWFEAEEGSLPAVVPIKKVVTLPDETQAYYDKAKAAIIAAHGNYKEVKNIFLRMRQISSGFIGYKDDETGEKAKFVFPTNPKLDYTMSLIQSIRADRKIVLFHEFVYSGEMIERELTRLGIGNVRLWGGTKNAADVLHRFDHDKKCQVFLVNNAAGGFGLNLQIAKYALYYESPVSPYIRKQTERRTERQGSAHDSIFRYDIIVANTMDQRILDFHAEGANLMKAVMRGESAKLL